MDGDCSIGARGNGCRVGFLRTQRRTLRRQLSYRAGSARWSSPIRALTARESAGVAGMLEATGNRMEVVVLPQDAGAQSEAALRVDTSLTSVVLAGLSR